MTRSSSPTLLILLSFFALWFSSQSALATLGGSVDSVESDREVLKTSRSLKKASMPLYSIHTIESDGVTLNEFVSQDGVVFGLAWSGINHPDLENLLGSYVTEYHSALESTPQKKGARNRALKSENLVVEHWGHPRHLQGRAYAPNLLPKGMNKDEIH